ncbi:MAG: D-alanyl-D-alanine carboxypeptidase [Clostridia bacterium]|nr:D-alanyl-D-alanine carboxypeptidase [Clostridia bacterium]
MQVKYPSDGRTAGWFRRLTALAAAVALTALCASPVVAQGTTAPLSGKRHSAYDARTAAVTTTTAPATNGTTAPTASNDTSDTSQTTTTTAASTEIDENSKEAELAAETSSPQFNEDGTPNITAGAAIVMDCQTGLILYGLNENAQMPMASTTKIMTCILALESGDIGRVVTVTDDCMDLLDGTQIGLKVGDTITLYDLCVTMMMYSGNDAANTAAVAVSGSIPAFVSLMNEKAAELGMLNTHFDTPSGLDQFSDGAHYSSAYDMALLGRYAMQNADFRDIVNFKVRNVYFGEYAKHGKSLYTHNYLMEGQKFGYKGCDGIKTGVTNLAGQCLVSHVTTDEGIQLVCVSLNNTNRWSDHKAMYEYAKSLYEQVDVDGSLSGFQPKVVGGTKSTLRVNCETDAKLNILKTQAGNLKRELVYDSFLLAPIEKGDVVGYLQYSANGMLLASYPITAAESIQGNTDSWFTDCIRTLEQEAKDNE